VNQAEGEEDRKRIERNKAAFYTAISHYEHGSFDLAEDAFIRLEQLGASPEFAAQTATEWIPKTRKARDIFLDGLALEDEESIDKADDKFQELKHAMDTEAGRKWADKWAEWVVQQRKNKVEDFSWAYGDEAHGIYEWKLDLLKQRLTRLARRLSTLRSGVNIGSGFIIDSFIGHGSTGAVVQVHSTTQSPLGMVYACKNIEKAGNESKIANELSALKRGAHKHVVPIFYEIDTADYCNIIMQRAKHDLQTYLRFVSNELAPWTDDTKEWELYGQWRSRLFHWIYCLSATLSDLHKLDIRHRDIRPANILVDGDTILFADFSLAFSEGLGTSDQTTLECGGQRYAPPEAKVEINRATGMFVSKGTATGKEGDIFSFGCVIFEMLETLCIIGLTTWFPEVVKGNYAASISDSHFVNSARLFKENEGHLGKISEKYQFRGLAEKVLGIVLDKMMVMKGKRCNASCATKMFREAMSGTYELNCCIDRIQN
jgi:Protein kinase domain